MPTKKTTTTTSSPKKFDAIELSWVIIGEQNDKLWWGYKRHMSKGSSATVKASHSYAMDREEKYFDVLGFMHTHPHWKAEPSDVDRKTMQSWVDCFGKSLLCIIKGTDGLRAWWFDQDEDEPIECGVKMFNSLLVGTTELDGIEDKV